MTENPGKTNKGRVYTECPKLYDLIYHYKDYKQEAEEVHARLVAEGVPDGARLLDVACGTGAHLETLRQWYAVAGVDLNEEMLQVARRRLSAGVDNDTAIPLWKADMRTVTLANTPWRDQPVDAITCLFSSIGYMPDESALKMVAKAFAGCLKPGGVVLLQPFIAPENFLGDHHVQLDTYSGGDLHAARACDVVREDNVAVVQMHWLVAREGKGVERFDETHRLTMFTEEQLLDFRAAGFDCRFDPNGDFGTTGRGLLICKLVRD